MRTRIDPNRRVVQPGRRCVALNHDTSWQPVNESEKVMVCEFCTIVWREAYRKNGGDEELADAFVQKLRREGAR